MNASVLLDTGAILALLNKQDSWHAACVQAISQLSPPLLTSEAVLTEALYMVSANSYRVESAWTFIRSGILTLGAITDADLPALAGLMFQYRDRPMDFTDATLVHLAQRQAISTVFTTDLGDFQTYRIGGQKRFRILPGKPNH